MSDEEKTSEETVASAGPGVEPVRISRDVIAEIGTT
jgi:hypothetical protein